MIVKGNINEVCKQLHALKKAFVENNVTFFRIYSYSEGATDS